MHVSNKQLVIVGLLLVTGLTVTDATPAEDLEDGAALRLAELALPQLRELLVIVKQTRLRIRD